jgi:hypothetical protein
MNVDHHSRFFRAARVRAGFALAIALLACAGAHVQARAQSQSQAHAVQRCQVDGRLVIQSMPCAREARANPGTLVAVAAAAPADAGSAPKKKSLADLLRERDGADRARPQAREFQRDGSTVLRSRMGAV